ncbi:hypothetical protein [Pseudonocardia sp.]|uniref:hypothetical protein n=1 Tax=Pseudonocardia sp. TaxID=60912 RepID=UPI003D0DDEE7
MTTFSLLPHASSPLAVDVVPPTGDGIRRRVELQVGVEVDGAPAGPPIGVTRDLRGAGDVIGIDRRMISRVEPATGSRAVEPNYLPLVEFVDADFPWRYTLDRTVGRLRPWLVLAALRAEEFEFVELAGAPLPAIRVREPRTALPDLAQSWAWAHVHVSRDAAPGVPVDELVRTRPDASFARLLCPRRLADSTVYHLFLLPAFEAGRAAGLGRGAGGAAWDAPAWDAAGDQPHELPFYLHSRFVTSGVEDFEVLARRLRPAPAATIATRRTARADDPGFLTGYAAPAGAAVTLHDALARPGTTLGPNETDPALLPRLAETLTEAIAAETEGADAPDAEDPLLAPPAYGWRSAPTRDVRPERTDTWFDRLNVDLALREVAGLGARTVRQRSEELLRLCWAQHEEAVAATERLGRFRLAAVLAERLVTRRFARLPAQAALAAVEPLQPYQRVGGGTVRDALRRVGVPATFASRDLRRAAAKRPVRGATPAVPMPTLPSGRDVAGLPTPAKPIAVPAALTRFVTDVLGAAPVFEPVTSPVLAVPVGALRAAQLVAPFHATLTRLPGAKAAAVLEGLSGAERARLVPAARTPALPVELAPMLVATAPERLLSGLDGLPEDTVALLEEHRPFVEAFLVGANHELSDELRWRGFPTDARGTPLARFWDRGRPAGDITAEDIPPVSTWTRPLGQNFPAHDDGRADLVVVLRSDAVRRFGQLVVVLNRGTSTGWQPGQGTDHHPVFFGRLGPDVAYYGFALARDQVLADRNRYFLVLHEPVGRLRFGFDVATASVRRGRQPYGEMPLPFALRSMGRTREAALPTKFVRVPIPPITAIPTWDDLSWSHATLGPGGYVDVTATRPRVTSGPDWWGPGATSATIARSLWQRPVAVVVPARRLL